MKWSKKELEAMRSKAGGWNRETLAKLGVNWPPKKGWKSALILGLDPNDSPRHRTALANEQHREMMDMRALYDLKSRGLKNANGAI